MKQQDNILTFILCLILWSLIIFVFLFIIMVDKVFAETPTTIRIYKEGNTQLNEYSNTTSFTYSTLQNSNRYDTINIYYNQDIANSKHVYFSGFYRLNVSDVNVPRIHWGAWYMDSSWVWHEIRDSCTNSGTRRDVDPNAIFEQNITCQFDTTQAIKGIVIRYYFTNKNDVFYPMNGIIFNQISNTFSADSSEADNINANNDKNTNIIVNNNNQNTESIINNNNQNTTEITNAIENINMVCNNYNQSITDFPGEVNKRLRSDGSLEITNNWWTTQEIDINSNKVYKITKNYTPSTDVYYCTYTDNTLIACVNYASNTVTSFNSGNANKIRITKRNGNNDTTYFEGEYCYNSQEEQIKQNEEINNNLENINDSLTSTEAPSSLNLPSNPFGENFYVSALFYLPIQMAQSFGTTCTPYSITFLNKTITFPCINLERYLGSSLWGVIDLLFVFGLVMGIGNLIRRVYISFTTLSDELYIDYYGRPETYGDLADYNRRHGGASE